MLYYNADLLEVRTGYILVDVVLTTLLSLYANNSSRGTLRAIGFDRLSLCIGVAAALAPSGWERERTALIVLARDLTLVAVLHATGSARRGRCW